MSVMMHDFVESAYKVSRSYLSIKRDVGGWREGIFHHRLAVVRVFEARTPRLQQMSMTFNHEGRSYHRRWDGVFGDKTIARLAREFVEDVCQST